MTGTGNPYHDERGQFCSKNEMGAIVDTLKNDMIKAQGTPAFDGAFERYETFKTEYVEATTRESMLAELGVEKPKVAKKVETKAVAKDALKKPLGSGSLAIDALHTYDVPAGGQLHANGSGHGGNNFKGGKYDSKLSTGEIVKNLRSDFKEAQDKGFLPKGLKFNVTKPHYNSIDISVHGVADKDMYVQEEDSWGRSNRVYSKDALRVRQNLDTIANAYNYDDNNTQYDVHGYVNYYSHVHFIDEEGEKYEAREKAASKAYTQGLKVRKSIDASVANLSSDQKIAHLKKTLPFKEAADKSGSIAIIPGTQLVAVTQKVVYDDLNTKYYGNRDHEKVEVYDLSKVSFPDGFEKTVKAYGSVNVFARRKPTMEYRTRIERKDLVEA